MPSVTSKPPFYRDAKPGDTISLQGVLFRQSEYKMLPEANVQLDNVVNTLKEYPQLRVLVVGHTDNVGNPLLNQALSENRAQVIANYLVNKGVDEQRVQTTGCGGKFPLASNEDEEGRRRNRRVKIVIR